MNEADEIVIVKGTTYSRLIESYGGKWIIVIVNIVMTCFLLSSIYANNVLLEWANKSPEEQQLKFTHYSVLVFSAATATALFVFARVLTLICGNLRAIKLLHNSMLHKVLCAPINLYYDVTPIG